jgi:hypothetical protein
MRPSLDVRFRNVVPSPTLEATVQQQFSELAAAAAGLVSCDITVHSPRAHLDRGELFAVTIDLRFADGEIVASRHPGVRHAYDDPSIAVLEAFAATRRQLENRLRSRGELHTS